MKTNLYFFLARFGYGGAGNSVYRLCKSLNKKKFNINVICLNSCAYEKNLKKDNIKLYKIKSNRALFSIFKLNKLFKSILNNDEKTAPARNAHPDWWAWGQGVHMGFPNMFFLFSLQELHVLSAAVL